MQRFFESVIEPIFEKEGIKTIVEIGADRGFNTAKLIGYADKCGGRIYSVDPVPSFDSDKWESENPNSFKMIKDLSLNVIKNINDADCFLIDGDHNWYTVYNELCQIYDVYGEADFPLVMFHDILWPYDRRDLYYSPETIPDIYRHEYEKKAISPDSEVLTDNGINGRLFNAKKYGGAKNGVLTAIEDFLREHPSLGLDLYTIDVFHGLGMIASKSKFPKAIEHFYSVHTLKEAMKLCENERLNKSVETDKLKKEALKLSVPMKMYKSAKIYPDFGNGYREGESVTIGDYNIKGDSFYAEFSFDKAPLSLRFDPVNDAYCIIENITVAGDGVVMQPASLNGVKLGSGYIFKNFDPQIIYDNVCRYKSFRIKADIYCFKSILVLNCINKMLSKTDDLTVQKHRLESENTMFAEKNQVLEERVVFCDKKIADLDSNVESLKNNLQIQASKIRKDNGGLAMQLLKLNNEVGYKYALKCVLRSGPLAAKANIKAIKTIRQSGRDFDALYYYGKYRDVLLKGMDPLVHFMWFGGYEGRNPNESFNVKEYLNLNQDVKNSGINPYAHYILWGRDEGRQTVLSQETPKNTLNNSESSIKVVENLGLKNIHSFNFTNIEQRLKSVINTGVDVVIPVYNAYEETKDCIECLIENTDFPHRLIIINDCSSDPRIKQFLDGYEGIENITIFNSEKNHGFVWTANFGINQSKNDVVLLNSDTKVSKGWLKKLAVAACQSENVATVTPFSNAAGAFSVPNIGENKDIPDGFTFDEMAQLVQECSNLDYVQVPTGNGFCMYITRKAIDSVGILDYDTFTQGYGEENDFCMRAKLKGFVNIIADDTYIYHKRSASFKEEKQQLITKNRKILDERYPTYTEEIKIFKNSDLLIENRSRIKNAVDAQNSSKYSKKRVLYVLHSAGGGTVKTNEDLMMYIENNGYEVYMLNGDNNKFNLYAVFENKLTLIKTWTHSQPWDVNKILNNEYRDIYFDVIYSLHIDIVHVRHVFKNSFDIFEVCDILNVPTIVSFHDFYFICPTINLINSDGVYCEGNCRDCDTSCILPNADIQLNGMDTNNWVKTVWQPAVKKYLKNVKAFITTADYVKKLYVKIYPDMESRFSVIEHGRDFDYEREYCGSHCQNDKIRVLFPGNINYQKGSKYIKQLIDLDTEGKIEFHIMGHISGDSANDLNSKMVYHGAYKRDEFKQKLLQIKPDYIGILSIWPETYCHVLTEAWSCGMPCIVSDVGVLKDRGTGNGCILADLNNPQKTYDEIIRISSNKDEYARLCREALSAAYISVADMGVRYKDIYDKLCFR